MADTPSKQHGHGVDSEGGLSVSSAGQPNLRHPPLPHSGHKASFRSANKLARRARSFKEDFLERISAMSLRGQGPGHDHRSHSPLSPKARSAQKSDDPESNPARDLELLVRQVRFDLKHFCDVISKKKLEMLPGNGTIVLDTITNIHTAIRPYVSPLGASPSAALASALARLCQALAQLIRLCDEGMLGGEGCAALQSSNVENVTQEVQKSVEELAAIAFEKMAGRAASKAKANGTAGVEPKNLKLQVRPGVDGVRNSVNDNQRNSLPDIPLTPRERHILEMSGAGLPVRTSHSTESILDSLATSPHPEPPPKPPRPVRTMDIAPPLPPKKKSTDNSSLLGLSTIDRVSLQSHSSGSLDSILNISNDEEIRAIMDRSSTNLEDSVQHTTADILGLCGCPDGYSQTNGNRSSLESNSTIGTVSSVGAPGNRLSNEMVPGNQQHGANNRLSSEMTSNHCDTNHNRFSNESGFVSMGNNRSSEISYSSFNSSSTTHQHHQKTSLAFIDSTPTPGDIPSSIITDFCEEKPPKIPSPIGKTLTVNSMANVVQQSMKQMTTSSNLFEQNSSKMIGFNGKITQAFNHTSKTSNSAFKSTEISNNAFEFGKSLKVESVSQSFQSKTQNVSTTIEGSLDGFAANNGGFSDAVDAASSLPPALPIKTRRCLKGITSATCDNLNESGISLMSSSFDDTIEFRDHSCSLQGPDGLMQRPHTLMDASGQPPPLPLKKKHMFQNVAYSVMAYMEMFGNCSHSPQSSTEFMRHSVHAYNQAGGVVTQTQLQQMALNSQLLNYTQHMQQFTVSNSQQNLSGFSSPLRSPRLAREDSIKSDASSVNSISTSGSVPPALPPKRTKIRPASQQSPAKPISPAPLLLPPGAGSVTPSPCSASPLPVSSTSPAPTLAPPISPLPQQVSPSPGSVTSPPPRFQFHPPPAQQNIEDTLLLNVEDDSWQQRSPNKPGKFPVDDLDLEQRTNASSSPGSQNAEPSIDTETEDIILDMDVSSRLVYKRSNEEGPEIRGGHPDALVVHAIKCTKDFSYQEAFLTTYRTFVTPKELIEKLNRRHAFLARHGKHTKAREVQGLLTRIVGDLTLADLDSDLLQLIMDFVYGLVNSGDLAMAKVLRVIILDKHKSKQIMVQQQQQQAFSGVCQVVMSARRDSVLEQKAEAVAEQMTLLDAELFTRIPAPEALLWARDQCEERSPNLTRFTEHFNKMSFWARSRILEQEEQREREKYVTKFIKVMKHLRKMNNFNSYLALLSALDSAPVRRLEWQKHITDGLKEYCALIDSSSSFRAYRQALAETNPPCIPYIGLVLQDLTFVHIGNTDLLPDGSINFSKRWQQYHILENMKRFSKAQYTFKKNERIISMFNGFDDVLNEEAMWQISESIKPRKKTAVT